MEMSMPTSGSGPDNGSPAADDPVGKDTLKRDARAVVGEAQSVVDEVKSEASAQIEQLAGQAKEQLSQASDKVRGIASDQKDLLADQVGGVAQALERVASDLQSSNDPSAQYARMIADNAERLSSSIRDNSVDQLMGMAQDFGRRQPAAFIGAAALLGFAASRFLMASASRPAQPQTEQPRVGDDAPLPASQPDLYVSDVDRGRL
jgi:hypothetical protein